jgi:hypothetical protein
MNTIKKCVGCGKDFSQDGEKPSRWKKRKYCSKQCFTKSITIKMTGERLELQRRCQKKMIDSITPEMRVDMNKRILETRKLGTWYPSMQGKKGELCPHWLGEKAGYNGKHRWIQQNWEKTGTCERCGKTPKPYWNRKYGTEWSNNSGECKRERSDWEELCKSCHNKKDRKDI